MSKNTKKELKKVEFKDYYSIPKNATFIQKNVSYKKNKILEKSLSMGEDKVSLASFEMVRADRLLFVIDLLQYNLQMHTLKLKILEPAALVWFRNNEKRLTYYLNNADPSCSFYTPSRMYQ